jgi:hypothetical protein
VNVFIESIYGKQFRLDEAAKRSREIIAAEDENIRAMNGQLSRFPEKPWPLPGDFPPQKEKLKRILNANYTQNNTISSYDLERIKAETQKPGKKILPPEKRHKWKIAAVSKTVSLLEKIFPPVKKIRMQSYSRIFRALDTLEKSLDVCGWHAEEGKYVCRRNKVNCCETGMPCKHLTASGCTAECLSCKFWLCGTALSYLQDIAQNKAEAALSTGEPRKKAARFLKLRERYGFLCRAFNIPLKIRCSKVDAFRWGRGPSPAGRPVDTQLAHWADLPLRPAAPPKNPKQKPRPYTKLKRPKISLEHLAIKRLDKKTIIVIIGLLAALVALI